MLKLHNTLPQLADVLDPPLYFSMSARFFRLDSPRPPVAACQHRCMALSYRRIARSLYEHLFGLPIEGVTSSKLSYASRVVHYHLFSHRRSAPISIVHNDFDSRDRGGWCGAYVEGSFTVNNKTEQRLVQPGRMTSHSRDCLGGGSPQLVLVLQKLTPWYCQGSGLSRTT